MQKVIEQPTLPDEVVSLARQLMFLFSEYGYRLNRVLPTDGSEDVQFVSLVEITDPAAPVTNKARLYARDNGAGKTELVVRFATGAIQVLSTEP